MTTTEEDYTYNDYDQKPDPPHQPMYLAEILRQLHGSHAKIVLDAGCGDGNFAASIAQAGFKTYGVDLSPSGIRIATERDCGEFARHSLYEDLRAPFGVPSFDAIYTVEVIEHLYSPKRFVERVSAALRPGGVFVVTTPYWGYWKNLALAISNRTDKQLTALWEGGHIKHFSRATLTELMRRAGLEAIAFRGAGEGLRAHTPYLWNGMVMTFRKPSTGD